MILLPILLPLVSPLPFLHIPGRFPDTENGGGWYHFYLWFAAPSGLPDLISRSVLQKAGFLMAYPYRALLPSSLPGLCFIIILGGREGILIFLSWLPQLLWHCSW